MIGRTRKLWEDSREVGGFSSGDVVKDCRSCVRVLITYDIVLAAGG